MRPGTWAPECWIIATALLAGLLGACASPGPEPTLFPAPSSAPSSAEATATVAAERTATAAPTQTAAPSPPDLTPPPGGWIAFSDPSYRPVLTSADGARRVTLSKPDRFAVWSPDGLWLLGQSTGQALDLLSLRDGHTVTVTDRLWLSSLWSQDSRFVAHIRQYTDVIPWRYELDLYEVASGDTITVTRELPKYSEYTVLCGPPFPDRFLAVYDLMEGVLRIYDRQSNELAAGFHAGGDPDLGGGSGLDSMIVWLTDGKGVIYARPETDMKAMTLAKCAQRGECTGPTVARPMSLAVWRAGDSAPRTVLQAEERRRYWPEGWLPDGRLEVRQMDWERDEYEGSRAQAPQSVQYRYFRVDAEGQLQEVEAGNLPWWAGGGLDQRVQQAALPPGAIHSGHTWSVSPDGKTVAFTWIEDGSTSVYYWDGVGQPVWLGEGQSPQWQPVLPEGTR